MKTNSKNLLADLLATIKANTEAAEKFNTLPDEVLNLKPAPDAWSILECLEHLNLYSAFYLPEIEKHLRYNSGNPKADFKSGLWGNYLVKMVIPKEGGKKMKTFASMNPQGSQLGRDVVRVFIESQQDLANYIEMAKSADLNKTGIPVTFTRLIKLKLGDALRFMAYHNQRHVQQALRNL